MTSRLYRRPSLSLESGSSSLVVGDPILCPPFVPSDSTPDLKFGSLSQTLLFSFHLRRGVVDDLPLTRTGTSGLPNTTRRSVSVCLCTCISPGRVRICGPNRSGRRHTVCPSDPKGFRITPQSVPGGSSRVGGPENRPTRGPVPSITTRPLPHPYYPVSGHRVPWTPSLLSTLGPLMCPCRR